MLQNTCEEHARGPQHGPCNEPVPQAILDGSMASCEGPRHQPLFPSKDSLSSLETSFVTLLLVYSPKEQRGIDWRQRNGLVQTPEEGDGRWPTVPQSRISSLV
jgi:hypothetical protein